LVAVGEELDDPAALYGSQDMAAVGQPAWYSIDGYSYGINDWRGTAVAENKHHAHHNEIPLDDVTRRTGNRNAAVTIATTPAPVTTTASR